MSETVTALKMTPTCAAIIRNHLGDKTGTARMRRDVFGKAVTRCIQAGWLVDSNAFPYSAVTDLGRRAIVPDAMTRDEMASWFLARGVSAPHDLDTLLNRYAGKTETEMNALDAEMRQS